MKKNLASFFILIFLSFQGFAEIAPPPAKSTICLNMIVKNEKDVITRCLKSVLPIIDYWVIVDTGSTDGTQEIIKDFLKNVPGELHERPWVNFGHNRDEALNLAKTKADYLLFIDADDTLTFAPDFKLPTLTKDFYHIYAKTNNHRFRLMSFVKADVNWKWYGAIHEYLQAGKDTEGAILEGIEYTYINDGSRSKDPATHQKDIAILLEAIEKAPDFPRNYFYLAKTYLMSQQYEKALEAFAQRSRMKGGWDEEIFASLISVGQIQNLLKKDSETIKKSFIDAYLFMPHRPEPLYYLLEKVLEEGLYEKGFEIAKAALELPKRSKAALFEEMWISDYGIPYQYAFCAAKTKRFQEGKKMCETVLQQEDLPPPAREKIKECLDFIYQEIHLETQAKLKSIILN